MQFSCSENSSDNKIITEIRIKASEAKTECQKFDTLDKEMRRVLNEIRTQYKSDQVFIKKLNSSQAYWIPYMNSHVRAIYPKDWDRVYRKEYGRTEFNECKCKELNKLMFKRIEDLTAFLDPDYGQDDCPGVMKN
jgi:hypothetical protein